MELALYHPRHGFYTSGRARLGREGDYFTNVSVGAAFARLLALQFTEMWHALDRPSPFLLVEQGAHHGDFARDVLQWSASEAPDFFEMLRYCVVEPAEILRERQRETLKEFDAQVTWKDSPDQLEPFCGVFFSNELIDALPVHLLSSSDAEGWKERRIRENDNGFEFVSESFSESEVFARAVALPRVAGSYETELSVAAPNWMKTASSRIARGFFVAVDYGYTREQYYSEERRTGTLQVRRGHQLLTTPLEAIGRADITAHVDWTSIMEAGEEAGLRLLGLTDQYHFLTGILSANPEFVDKADAKTRRQIQTLIHPEMLGRTFQTLVMSGGLETRPTIAGLKFAGVG